MKTFQIVALAGALSCVLACDFIVNTVVQTSAEVDPEAVNRDFEDSYGVSAPEGYKGGLDELKGSVNDLQTDLDGLTQRFEKQGRGVPASTKDLATTVWESGEFAELQKKGRGRAIIQVPELEVKATLLGSGVGSATSGVSARGGLRTSRSVLENGVPDHIG